MPAVWAWGANSYGQLGLGHASEQEPQPRVVAGVAAPALVAGGGGHTLLVDGAGAVHGCGWNSAGQLGLGHTRAVTSFTRLPLDTGVRHVAAGWDFSVLVTERGEVFTCGSNTFGQLGGEHD